MSKIMSLQNQSSESHLEQLTKIIDNVPVMLCYIDEQGEFKLVNRHFERVLGWNLESMRGRDMMAEFYPDPAYRAYVLDYVRNPPTGFSEFRTRTRDGRSLTTSWANVLLSDGTSIGIGMDLTDELHLQSQLMDSERRIRKVADSVPVLMAYIDKGLRYQFCNRTYCEWWQLRRNEIIGRNIADVLGVANFAAIKPMIERTLAGEQVRFELELTLGDGTSRHAEVEYRPDCDERGDVCGIFAVITDVTERHELQRKLLAAESLARQAVPHPDKGVGDKGFYFDTDPFFRLRIWLVARAGACLPVPNRLPFAPAQDRDS